MELDRLQKLAFFDDVIKMLGGNPDDLVVVTEEQVHKCSSHWAARDVEHPLQHSVAYILEILNAGFIAVKKGENRQRLYAQLGTHSQYPSRDQFEVLASSVFSAVSRLSQAVVSGDSDEKPLTVAELEPIQELMIWARSNLPDMQASVNCVDAVFGKLFKIYQPDQLASEFFKEIALSKTQCGADGQFHVKEELGTWETNSYQMYRRFSGLIRFCYLFTGLEGSVLPFRRTNMIWDTLKTASALTMHFKLKKDEDFTQSENVHVHAEKVFTSLVDASQTRFQSCLEPMEDTLKCFDMTRLRKISDRTNAFDDRRHVLALYRPLCEQLIEHQRCLEPAIKKHNDEISQALDYLYLMLPFVLQYKGKQSFDRVKAAFDVYVTENRANLLATTRGLVTKVLKDGTPSSSQTRVKLYENIKKLREFQHTFKSAHSTLLLGCDYWEYCDQAYAAACEHLHDLDEKQRVEQLIKNAEGRRRLQEKKPVKKTEALQRDSDDDEVLSIPDTEPLSIEEAELNDDVFVADDQGTHTTAYHSQHLLRAWNVVSSGARSGLLNRFAQYAMQNASNHFRQICTLAASLDHLCTHAEKGEHVHTILQALSLSIEQLISAAVLEKCNPADKQEAYKVLRHNFTAMLKLLGPEYTQKYSALLKYDGLEQWSRSLHQNGGVARLRDEDPRKLITQASRCLRGIKTVKPQQMLDETYVSIVPILNLAWNLMSDVTGKSHIDVDVEVSDRWLAAVKRSINGQSPTLRSSSYGQRSAALRDVITIAKKLRQQLPVPARPSMEDAIDHLHRVICCLETMDRSTNIQVAVKSLHRYMSLAISHACIGAALSKKLLTHDAREVHRPPHNLWYWIGLFNIDDSILTRDECDLCDRSPHILQLTRYTQNYQHRSWDDAATQQFLSIMTMANKAPIQWKPEQVKPKAVDDDGFQIVGGANGMSKQRKYMIDDALVTVDAGLALIKRILERAS